MNNNLVQQLSPSIDDIVQQVVDELPQAWTAAELVVDAQPIAGELELAVCVRNPAEPRAGFTPSPRVVDAIVALCLSQYHQGRMWNRMSARFEADALDNWSVDTFFEHETDPRHVVRRTAPKPPPMPPATISTTMHSHAAPVTEMRPWPVPPAASDGPPATSEAFRREFSLHAACSLDKHYALNDFLGDDVHWEFDAASGVLHLGDSLSLAVQVLGIWCEQTHTWRWAWDCPGEQIATVSLRAAEQLRQFGGERQIAEFTRGSLTSEEADPEIFAMTACGLCGADFWFECDDPRQALLVLGWSPEVAARRAASVERSAFVLSELTANFVVDHRQAACAWFEQPGWRLRESADSITATCPAGNILQAGFDESGRLRTIEVSHPPVGTATDARLRI